MSDLISFAIETLSRTGVWFSLMMVGIISAWFLASAKTAATTSISLGIFFTFIGISAGLQSFNPETLDDSVMNLVDGLKTAFHSSLVGMFVAIAIRLVVGGKEERAEKTTAKFWEDKIKDSLDGIILSSQNSSEGLGYLQKMYEYNERHSAALEQRMLEQQEFVKEGLATAVQQSTTSIENSIRQQLGESFRQFSGTIEGLGAWMDEYRKQLETDATIRKDISLYADRVAGSMNAMSSTLSSYGDSVQRMQSTVEALERSSTSTMEAIRGLDDMLKTVASSSDALATSNERWLGIAENAGSMQDSVQGFMQAATDSFHANTEQMREAQAEHTEVLLRLSTATSAAFEKLQLKFQETVQSASAAQEAQAEAFNAAVDKTLKNYLETMRSSMEPILETLEHATSAIDPSVIQQQAEAVLRTVSEEMRATLTEQLLQIQEAVQDQGNQTVIGLGSALNEVTMRVAKDYGGFIESLRSFTMMVDDQIKTSQRILNTSQARSAATQRLT